MNRETWLNQLAGLMADTFNELGFPLPAFRVSIGFTGASSRALGVCYSSKVSADGRFEIFIVPKMADAVDVGAILAHELTHAAVGLDQGHKGNFGKVVAALGFERPFTHLRIGANLRAWLESLLAQLPPLPHASLDVSSATMPAPEGGDGEGEQQPRERTNSNERKKQTTRMLKATCQAIAPADGSGDTEPGQPCGYTVRLSKKWALKYGACCPVHGGMEVEGADDSGGEDDADE